MNNKLSEWTLTKGLIKSSKGRVSVIVANGPMPLDCERILVLEQSNDYVESAFNNLEQVVNCPEQEQK